MQALATRGNYTLHAFEAEDWQELKAARAAMIADMGEAAEDYNYYKRDFANPDSFWQAQAAGNAKRHFALYLGNTVVGNTAFEIRQGGEVLFTDTYIFHAERGKGLSSLLYEGRMRAARENPDFKVVRLFVSPENLLSQKAAERSGFVKDKNLNEFGALIYTLPLRP